MRRINGCCSYQTIYDKNTAHELPIPYLVGRRSHGRVSLNTGGTFQAKCLQLSTSTLDLSNLTSASMSTAYSSQGLKS